MLEIVANSPSAGPARAFEQPLHCGRAVVAQQAAQLGNDLSAGSLGAEKESRDGNDDDEHGCNREERVIGQCGAHARGMVLPPGHHGHLDQGPDTGAAH